LGLGANVESATVKVGTSRRKYLQGGLSEKRQAELEGGRGSVSQTEKQGKERGRKNRSVKIFSTRVVFGKRAGGRKTRRESTRVPPFEQEEWAEGVR